MIAIKPVLYKDFIETPPGVFLILFHQQVKSNRHPVLVPCHRVIRSDGSAGGFSGPSGWKEMLLYLSKPVARQILARRQPPGTRLKKVKPVEIFK